MNSPHPLFRCMSKATTAKGDQRGHDPNWITARRARLNVFPNRLECGDWTIQNSEIENATLFSFRTGILRIPGYVLSVHSAKQAWHFGLNGWNSYWKSELPFPVKRESGRLGYSKFSLAIRAVAFVCLAYLIWQRFG